MKIRGFTLLEVLIALVILSLLVMSVFHFFSNTARYHQKIGQRYKLLRAVKTFISNFTPGETRGQKDEQNFRFQWDSQVVRDQKKVRIPGQSGGGVFSRLNRVKVRVYRIGSSAELFSTTFLINELSAVKE